jgi:hypothetical protein
MKLNTTTLCHYTRCRYAECHCADSHALFYAVLDFFMLSVIMLNDILLNGIMLSNISHYAECLYAMLTFLIADCHYADFIMLSIKLYFMICRMSLY